MALVPLLLPLRHGGALPMRDAKPTTLLKVCRNCMGALGLHDHEVVPVGARQTQGRSAQCHQ
ncbi:hypothetical protein PVAP13_4NG339901 [Panicum virgatum]|uniref:Uncharacterized protein n=1 Tax=Panicum virgatum TaxID=38727 RepID=A0A8T0TAV5_PANVG|nr:hypothetical protein PVAP13_4NG339901 [Panicum virgatum]